MSKLMRADEWIERNFLPGHQPPPPEVRRWALEKRKGVELAGKLYIYDDALDDRPAHLRQTAPELSGASLIR